MLNVQAKYEYGTFDNGNPVSVGVCAMRLSAIGWCKDRAGYTYFRELGDEKMYRYYNGKLIVER